MIDLFQSTHPVWGATSNLPGSAKCPQNFNPRTPCGVRRNTAHLAGVSRQFQSTHPVWGATPSIAPLFQATLISIPAPRVGCDDSSIWVTEHEVISIHAPRVGCDFTDSGQLGRQADFNPRTPCGVRPVWLDWWRLS